MEEKGELRAVHYMKPDTWEMERWSSGAFGLDYELIVSDVPSREEFDMKLAAMGVRVGERMDAPLPHAANGEVRFNISEYIELFGVEALP